jgi:hypothetical protein
MSLFIFFYYFLFLAQSLGDLCPEVCVYGLGFRVLCEGFGG